MKRSIIMFCVFLLLFGGCAFTKSTLDIAYDVEKAREGPLSSLRPLIVEIGEFTDKRPETDKIGYKRNGFGGKTASIVTKQPVPQIIHEAFVAEFKKNGISINKDNKDISITGAITIFWFDMKMGFWTVEFMGTVGVELQVIDDKTGDIILTRSYQGHYNEKSMGGYNKSWERVMNIALERMVRQACTDPKFLKALRAI